MRKLVLASVLAIIVVALVAALLIGKSVPATEQRVTIMAPAVTEEGTGVLVPFEVSLRPGTGRILVDLDNAFYREDMENSLRKARAIAARELGFNPASFDVEVKSVGGERTVSGESAGALFTVAIASAFAGRHIRNDTSMSAVINEDGSLGPIESLKEKLDAASKAGVTRFVVAPGQIVNPEAVPLGVVIVRAANAREAITAMLA
jgi:predicted S18 family serine protease